MAFAALDAHIGLIIAFYTVYLFIGQHVALVHFVKALYRIKELQSGDYMVISIDDFILDAEGNNAHKYTSSAQDPYLSAMKEDVAIQAFRSVLKVTESYPRNPDFKSVHIPNSFISITCSSFEHFRNSERTTTQESDGQNDEVLVPAAFLLGEMAPRYLQRRRRSNARLSSLRRCYDLRPGVDGITGGRLRSTQWDQRHGTHPQSALSIGSRLRRESNI